MIVTVIGDVFYSDVRCHEPGRDLGGPSPILVIAVASASEGYETRAVGGVVIVDDVGMRVAVSVGAQVPSVSAGVGIEGGDYGKAVISLNLRRPTVTDYDGCVGWRSDPAYLDLLIKPDLTIGCWGCNDGKGVDILKLDVDSFDAVDF